MTSGGGSEVVAITWLETLASAPRFSRPEEKGEGGDNADNCLFGRLTEGKTG